MSEGAVKAISIAIAAQCCGDVCVSLHQPLTGGALNKWGSVPSIQLLRRLTAPAVCIPYRYGG